MESVMDSFEMPASAFKADKYETQKDIDELRKRVSDLEKTALFLMRNLDIAFEIINRTGKE